jgi:hypothetical protein
MRTVPRPSTRPPDHRRRRFRCSTRGCAWRGSCPLHGGSEHVDLALAALMAERPYLAPLRAGAAA